MRLRVRSLETSETFRVEFPDSCTLDQFRYYFVSISSSPSPLYFSLDRKYDLHASSPDESLHSLGLRSGDLILYSPNPRAFLRHPETLGSSSSTVQENDTLTTRKEKKVCLVGGNEENNSDVIQPTKRDKTLMGVGEEVLNKAGSAVTEPPCWKKVLREKLIDDRSQEKLLITGVDAVLVEFGLVPFDPVSGKRIDRFDKLPSSVSYTLPALIGDRTDKVVSVVLKFQNLGGVIIVYGCLAKGGRGLHRLCLDKNKFGSILDLVCVNCDNSDSITENGDCLEFWKTVKDGLAFPLLIDMWEKTGLSLPPQFRILESIDRNKRRMCS